MKQVKIQKIIGLLITTLLVISCSENQYDGALKNSLEKLISNTKADIGLSIIDSRSNKILSINGDKLYPMLSTVKIPIALTVLNKVEKHEFSKDQELFISSEELLENTWSPFRDNFPNGKVTISLEEALTWMVVQSDNNITDVLIRLVGGEEYIEKF
ncbi:MAG: serine hydrolase [Chitinophagales bacterium]